jgi:hypothetical protein
VNFPQDAYDVLIKFLLQDACRNGFMTLPPVLLQEQPIVVLSLEGA